jgi:hypothetical protein
VLLSTKPFSQVVGIASASDVAHLQYSEAGLLVTVACQPRGERVAGLKVCFKECSAFRLLDEADLARYWNSPQFSRGAYVVEVLQGGWSAEEDLLQGHARSRREWIVITGNACVSVFCMSEPEVQSVELPGA